MSTKIANIAALVLAFGVSRGEAQSAAELYPYCAFRSGSTSCYHLTLESCGRSCIRNPAYVGDERARALRAALVGAVQPRERANGSRRPTAKVAGAFASGVVPGAAVGDGLHGDIPWTTGDRANRLGDFQAQGRF